MPHRYVWRKIRDVIVYRILGVKDSSHRIALGVAIAFFVAWTPTIGFQMIIAVALASLLGGNRAVTIPIVWITNPITAVPLYYTNWCVGHMIHRGSLEFDPSVRAALTKFVGTKGGPLGYLQNFLDASFWRELGVLLADCGIDLWIGSVLLGLCIALISYPICRRGVKTYRHMRGHDEDPGAPQCPRTEPTDTSPDESHNVINSNARS